MAESRLKPVALCRDNRMECDRRQNMEVLRPRRGARHRRNVSSDWLAAPLEARRPLLKNLQMGTVIFLFTDIEGSTELLQRLGDRLYAEVMAEHQKLLRDAFAKGNGRG